MNEGALSFASWTIDALAVPPAIHALLASDLVLVAKWVIGAMASVSPATTLRPRGTRPRARHEIRTMNEIDKLAWIHIRDKRLLGARSRGKSTYYLPGGKREPGESDEAALTREIKEELSIDLVPGSLRYIHTFRAQADGKPEGTQVKMTCYEADFRGEPVPAAEIEELRWLSHADVVRASAVTKIILDWLAANGSIE
ncbi:NTP pyrophosphohydrolase including oxidative damage repair enzyme [Minicystis rosea]|nr:NTP pyrophosphohydrolase including oxidative damage repair enzyme [Minicystis rosea]